MNRAFNHIPGAISCPGGFNSAPSKRKTDSKLNVPSARAVTEQLQSYLSEIEDPRIQRTRAHLLTDILIIGILSVIAGGKGCEDMENGGVTNLLVSLCKDLLQLASSGITNSSTTPLKLRTLAASRSLLHHQNKRSAIASTPCQFMN